MKLLKIEGVLEIIPMSKSTWYRILKDNKELLPYKIGRGSFWDTDEIERFIRSKKSI